MRSKEFLRKIVLGASLVAVSATGASLWLHTARAEDRTPASRDARGQVVSVDDKIFTLKVTKGDTTESIQFQTTDETQVQGKLEVGVLAAVEYRVDHEGNNIALSVVAESPA